MVVHLGEKILMRIAELDRSKRRVALDAGLSPSFVNAVIEGTKKLGIDSAKKLAAALEWPLSELLGTESGQVERWFWSARMGTLPSDELQLLRRPDALKARLAWTLRQVHNHYPDVDLAAAGNTSTDHVERLLREEGNASGQLLADFTQALNLPPHWLTIGEPGPSEELAQEVLQHRNANEYLAIVVQAMRMNVPPKRLKRLLDAFIEDAEEEK